MRADDGQNEASEKNAPLRDLHSLTRGELAELLLAAAHHDDAHASGGDLLAERLAHALGSTEDDRPLAVLLAQVHDRPFVGFAGCAAMMGHRRAGAAPQSAGGSK